MNNSSIGAVIFDLDGTLIDSKDVMRAAYYQSFDEVVGNGSAPPFSEYCQHLGRSFPEIMRRMGLPLEMHPVFVRESVRNMHKIRLFDGVGTLLHELARRGVPMAIATGKDQARTCAILDSLGLADCFAMVVGSDKVSEPKPAPHMALMIARQLHLDCATTLFVGDAIADLQCGQRAGMQTALATWDCPSEEAMRHPADFRLNHPQDILPLIRAYQHANFAIS